MVAGEVVATRPQRRERRGQPSAHFHEGADRRRGALAHGDANAFRYFRKLRAVDAMGAHHDAVAAFTLLAHFDPAADAQHRRHLQDRMRNGRAAERCHSKARCNGSDGERQRKGDGPIAQQNGGDNAGQSQRPRGPGRRLALGGEVERNPGGESDRQPRHEPSRRDICQRPLLQGRSETLGEARPGGGPGPRNSAPAAQRPRRRLPTPSTLTQHTQRPQRAIGTPGRMLHQAAAGASSNHPISGWVTAHLGASTNRSVAGICEGVVDARVYQTPSVGDAQFHPIANCTLFTIFLEAFAAYVKLPPGVTGATVGTSFATGSLLVAGPVVLTRRR